MNILDRVIQEWSYRTDKGYPDISSEEDMAIFESMFGFRLDKVVEQQDQIQENTFDREKYYKEYFENLAPSNVDVEAQGDIITISLKGKQTINEEEEQKQDNSQVDVEAIIDLVKSNKDNKKLLDRVYRTLSSTNDVNQVKRLLSSVGITKSTFSDRNIPAEIISILLGGKVNNIKEFINSTKTTFETNTKGTLYEKFDKDLPQHKIKALSNLDGFIEGTAIGKGELIFPILFSNVKFNTQSAGDFIINGKNAELKKSPGGRLAGSRAEKSYNPYYKEAKGTWVTSIKKDFELGRQREELSEVVKNMNEFIKEIYPKSRVFVGENSQNPVLDFAKASIDSYINDKGIEIYILFSPEKAEYRSFEPATKILDAIEDGTVKIAKKANPQIENFT